MEELSSRNFGIVIAYVLPGSVCVLGLSAVSSTVGGWVEAGSVGSPSIGGFLLLTLTALGAGLTVSAARWLFLDWIHEQTGLVRPAWDDQKLTERLEAFDYIVENHYRYYQFYGNTLLALLAAWAVRFFARVDAERNELLIFVAVMWVSAILFAGSRDALSKYYRRVERLLGTVPRLERQVTNGNHIEGGGGKSTEQPKAEKRPEVKDAPPAKTEPAKTAQEVKLK